MLESRMKMLPLRAISITFVLLVSVSSRVTLAGGHAPDSCISNELVISSGVIVGEVVLAGGGNVPQEPSVEIQLFDSQHSEWKSFGTVMSKGHFGWPAIPPGKYMLIAKCDGFREAKVYVRVNRRKGRLKDIIIPLKRNGCAPARIRSRR